MQHNRSKRYRAAHSLVEQGRKYPLSDALGILKKMPATKFDQTVTVSIRLGVDPKQSATAAQEAGAEHVGFEDLLKKVQGGFSDFDVAIATPAAMTEVRKLGKVLGPRGLMPNPKTGTVSDDTAKAVQEVKAGRVEFKLDKNGNIAVPVGKFSFTEAQLLDNGRAVIDAVVKSRPATAKGAFVESVTLAATMLPGIQVDQAPFLKN